MLTQQCMTFIKMSKIDQVLIKVSKIEEHLKSLNGTVARHEREIQNMEKDVRKTELKIAKLTAYALFGSAAGAFLANLVLKFIL